MSYAIYQYVAPVPHYAADSFGAQVLSSLLLLVVGIELVMIWRGR